MPPFETGSKLLIAGIGLRRGCDPTEIVVLVRQASAAVGRPVTSLAAPAFKSDEAGLAGAALILEVEILFMDDQALRTAQAGCVTHSAIAQRAVGFASVAEACALAAAGPAARLVLPRISGRSATCALAEAT